MNEVSKIQNFYYCYETCESQHAGNINDDCYCRCLLENNFPMPKGCRIIDNYGGILDGNTRVN